MLNDADAAGVAEARFGAARDRRGVVIVVTVGTGVGTALLNDGVLVAELGARPHRGERQDRRHLDLRREARREAPLVGAVGRAAQRVSHAPPPVLWPELIVIGGGVVKHADKFLDSLNPGCEVRIAELGNLAGIVGAALVAAATATES